MNLRLNLIKNLFCIFALFIGSSYSWSQNDAIQFSYNPNQEIDLLIKKAKKSNYWDDKKKDTFFFVLDRINLLSKQQNYLYGKSYYNYGMLHYYYNKLKNYDSAIYFAKQNLQIMEAHHFSNDETVESVLLLGLAHFRKQEYAKSYYYLDKSYKQSGLYPQNYILRDSIVLLYTLQSVKELIGMKSDPNNYVHTLKKLVDDNPEKTIVKGYGNMVLGHLYKKINPDSSIYYFKKTYHFAHKNISEHTNTYFQVLNSITKYYLEKSNTDSALYYLRQFEQNFTLPKQYDVPKDQDYYLHYLEHKAQYHYLKKEYQKSLQIIQPLYDSSKLNNNYDFIIHILPLMSQIYEKAGRLPQSLAFEREYNRLNDSINRTQLNLMYETQYQDQMQLLEEDIQSRDRHIALQTQMLNQRTIIIVVVVLSSLILAILVYTLKRNLNLKEKFRKEELERLQTKHELEILASKIKGIEEERNRLALDLHDGVANELWALKLQLNHLSDKLSDKGGEKKLLQQYLILLKNVIEDVRNIAKNLRPSLLIPNGLEAALWKFCERMNTNQSDLNISCNIYEKLPRFEEQEELSIYRIIQEIIQNALKHAKDADAINLQIMYSDSNLSITIEDNGCGMPTNFKFNKESNGLSNIYDRVKLLKGEISYLSYPNIGTCFTINFPQLTIALQHV